MAALFSNSRVFQERPRGRGEHCTALGAADHSGEVLAKLLGILELIGISAVNEIRIIKIHIHQH